MLMSSSVLDVFPHDPVNVLVALPKKHQGPNCILSF